MCGRRAYLERAAQLLGERTRHEHTEAQTHISRAVRSLLSTKAVDVVGLEGAFAPLALEPFRRFPHKDTMEIVADDLLKRHVISGTVPGCMVLD